jgi:DNA repair protein RadC
LRGLRVVGSAVAPPGSASVTLTVELVQAGHLLDIDLRDHLSIGQGRWVSPRRLGLGFPKTSR